MGGQLQTLFGILGRRAFAIEPSIGRHANAHWLQRPLSSEIPPNKTASIPLDLRSRTERRFKNPRKSCTDCNYW